MHEEILDSETKPKKNISYFNLRGVISWLCLLLLGFGFILMHWTGANILILTATAGLSAYSISALIRLKWKDTLNTVFSIMSFAWVLFLIYSAFLNDGIPYNQYGLKFFTLVFAACFVCYFLILGFLNSRKK